MYYVPCTLLSPWSTVLKKLLFSNVVRAIVTNKILIHIYKNAYAAVKNVTLTFLCCLDVWSVIFSSTLKKF